MSSLAKDTKGPFGPFSGQPMHPATLWKSHKAQRSPYLGSFSSTVFSSSHISFTRPFLMLLYETSIMKMKAGGLGGLFFYRKADRAQRVITQHVHLIIKLKHSETLEGHQMSHLIFRTEHGMKSLSRPQSLMLQNDKGCFSPGVSPGSHYCLRQLHSIWQ